MPGTHLLPGNLLKLFAPRPPLPYVRPVGKDTDLIKKKKNIGGIAELVLQLKEEKHDVLFSAAAQEESKDVGNLEEGEEPSYTLAEETKRQMRREDRKRRKEELFKSAKDTCEHPAFSF